MRTDTFARWPVRALVVFLGCLAFLTVHPYGNNLTAFFHMDAKLARGNPLPASFVVLKVPAYDGAQYYHVARNIPKLFEGSEWKFLRLEIPASYGYQRILLPFLAYALAFGQTDGLPYTFLLINIACLLLACMLMDADGRKPLYALALALCPAALIGLHFSLAEPLTIALLTWFLLRYEKYKTIGLPEAGLLSLLVLTREVNVLFAGFLTAYLLIRGQWKNALYSVPPLLFFVAFHAFLFVLFSDVPFLDSGAKHAFPFQAIIPLLLGQAGGYNRLTLSSIPLFLFFVAPALTWIIHELWTKRSKDFLPWALLAFLLLMTMMPDIIWGSMTSIGRVITPIYPLFLVYAARRDTLPARAISVSVLVLGLAIGIGLALIHHPYTVV